MVTQSDERLRQMLEWSPNAMVMVGSTGLIEMVNSETERIFGYSRDELLGKPIEKLLPERYRGNHRGLRTSFFAAPVSRPMGRTGPTWPEEGYQRVSCRDRPQTD